MSELTTAPERNNAHFSFRGPQSFLNRARVLKVAMGDAPVTSVLRLAIDRGLKNLEEEFL